MTKKETEKSKTYQQFSNITSALMGPIMMFGGIGYGISYYTSFNFGTEIGVIIGSILGMVLLIKEASKLQ